MSDRMRSIWALVQEKQMLEDAAQRLCEARGSAIGWKLSLSAAAALVVSLWPATGAALACAGLM